MYERIYGMTDWKLLELVENFKYVPYRLNKRSRYEVGKTYWNGYWHEIYTVLDVKPYGYVEVQWESGKINEHCTPLDHKRDFELREFPRDMRYIFNNTYTHSFTAGEIRAMMYTGIIRDIGNERMVERMYNEYFNMKNNRHIQNDSVYYFITTRTDVNGSMYYKLERDLKKSPHNFVNTKTYDDMLKDTRIGSYSLFDKENNPLTIKDKVPEWVPILKIKHVEGKRYDITLDAYHRDGHLYCRWEKEDLDDDKAYKSMTANYDRHILMVSPVGHERYCFNL
jgi:hypothetical protein